MILTKPASECTGLEHNISSKQEGKRHMAWHTVHPSRNTDTSTSKCPRNWHSTIPPRACNRANAETRLWHNFAAKGKRVATSMVQLGEARCEDDTKRRSTNAWVTLACCKKALSFEQVLQLVVQLEKDADDEAQ